MFFNWNPLFIYATEEPLEPYISFDVLPDFIKSRFNERNTVRNMVKRF